MMSPSHNSTLTLAEALERLEQAEEALRLMRIRADADAEGENIVRNRFLTAMNHEFRTHMNSVIGMIELLQHTELSPQQYGFAENAKNSGLELIRLLGSALDEADRLV